MKRRLILFAGFVMLGGFITYEIFWAPNKFEGDRIIIVSKGETFSEVVDSLQEKGVIRSRLLFELAGRIRGLTTRMQIGKYRFKSGMSNLDILQDLREGKSVEMVIVTIQEGLPVTKLSKLLKRELGLDSTRFLQLVQDEDFIRSVNVSAKSLEGYLMPSTYKFYWQSDEGEVIKELINTFWQVYDDSLRRVAEGKKITINEVLTLASIIEAETAIDSERAIIAGVYYNRLKKRMRLQADPTIQYIIDDGPRLLKYKDLKRESEYNTYIHHGLPPGPINNPGKASIRAALYPKKHRYIYFVANGAGGHTFSRTYTQHQQAVQHFRKLREEEKSIKPGGS